MSTEPRAAVPEKPAEPVEEVEVAFKSSELVLDAAARGQTTTGYENLTLWQTVKTFKVASLVCFAAAFSAATDGYQIG
jgi:hypothetical protein